MGNAGTFGPLESALTDAARQTAAGALTVLLGAALLLTVAWALAAGFRPRVR